MLNVLILVDFGFVVRLVKVRRVVVLISDSNTDKLGNCKNKKRWELVNEVAFFRCKSRPVHPSTLILKLSLHSRPLPHYYNTTTPRGN